MSTEAVWPERVVSDPVEDLPTLEVRQAMVVSLPSVADMREYMGKLTHSQHVAIGVVSEGEHRQVIEALTAGAIREANDLRARIDAVSKVRDEINGARATGRQLDLRSIVSMLDSALAAPTKG